ncbi:MAG: hypothetical protein ABSF52_16395 [Syntrophobacteraceae bacterium]|jgi:hypothetical protein
MEKYGNFWETVSICPINGLSVNKTFALACVYAPASDSLYSGNILLGSVWNRQTATRSGNQKRQ